MGLTDQKVDKRRYRAVPRTLCFITDGDDVLLLRGAATKPIWPNKYNGVGGHVEAGEDIHTSAIREIREETGLDVHELTLRGIVNIPVADQTAGIVVFVFTAVAPSRQVTSSDEGTLEWIPRGSLDEVDLVEDLPTLLPIVLGMPSDAPPFFAHYSYDTQGQLRIRFAPIPHS